VAFHRETLPIHEQGAQQVNRRDQQTPNSLPADFLDHLRMLEDAYCQQDDPIRQSGFSGGAQRWRDERSPLLTAVDTDGDLLDVGCANGYLLQCLIGWAQERGITIVPHGLDCGPRLIEMARQRIPNAAQNFHLANAWDWNPPRRYWYVYTLWDCVPGAFLATYCRRLLNQVVEPDGRLILGMYGSRSRNIPPIDLGRKLERLGFDVAGTTHGGDPPVTSFAWVDAG
jgi:SAM-dependent methyltransferase